MLVIPAERSEGNRELLAKVNGARLRVDQINATWRPSELVPLQNKS
jgi:hypothetical protein